MDQYLPIVTMLALAFLFAAGSFAASRLLGPSRPTQAKTGPYECGIVPREGPAQRFPVRFYLVAMIFIIFDIEIIFLYPWAVVYHQLDTFGLSEMVVFSVAVLFSLAYLISNGALDWGPTKRLAAPVSTCGRRVPRRVPARAWCTEPGREARRADGRRAAGRRRRPSDRTRRACGEPEPGSPTAYGAIGGMGLEDLNHNFLTGPLEEVVKWARAQERVAGHASGWPVAPSR